MTLATLPSEIVADDTIRGGFETAEFAADFLGVSKHLIYKLIRQGNLPKVQIGRAVRIPIQAIADFANDNMKGGV